MGLDRPADGSNYFQFEVLFPWLVKHNLELNFALSGVGQFVPYHLAIPAQTREKVSGERGD